MSPSSRPRARASPITAPDVDISSADITRPPRRRPRSSTTPAPVSSRTHVHSTHRRSDSADRIGRPPLRPGASVGLPKGIFAALRRQPPPIRVAPILLETSASLTPEGVYQRLRSRLDRLDHRRGRGATERARPERRRRRRPQERLAAALARIHQSAGLAAGRAGDDFRRHRRFASRHRSCR